MLSPEARGFDSFFCPVFVLLVSLDITLHTFFVLMNRVILISGSTEVHGLVADLNSVLFIFLF